MLKLEPCGRQNILECLRAAGFLPESPCNGKGLCGKCRVRVLSGVVSPLTEREKACLSAREIESGVRLACLAVPESGVEIDPLALLGEQTGKVLGGGELPRVELKPVLRMERIRPVPPDLENGWSLEESVKNALGREAALPLSLLRKLPELGFADQLWAVFRGDELLDLRPDRQLHGLAVDIGTTTVAVSLVDLTDGALLGEDGFVNPQKAFGLDVLSRIHYDLEHPGGVADLQLAIVERLQRSAQQLAGSAGVPLDSIYEIVVGGNATMLHCLLGVPLRSLGVAPYSSVFTSPMSVPARELGFALHGETNVYCIPSVSTYIGGDIAAGILASRLDEAKDTALFVDIGTNGEIVLSRAGRMYACSCAAGPALEGMNISCGMRAETGAVEHVTLTESGVVLGVIGGAVPRGLCGSGLLEAVSQAVKWGAIGRTGRISADSPFTDTDENGKRRLVLDREHGIWLTQNDIRQVQLCKGAILSGILTLMSCLELCAEDIDRIVVAGQFGKHLKPESLTGAELIPASLGDRITYIGNSSMAGARLCLLSGEERLRGERIAGNVDYIELSVSPGYEKLFTRCLQFGGV